VAADLKRAGLVEATRGAHGGYQLTRSPDDISMDGVVNALEGTIAPMECFVSLPTSRVACSHEADRGHACATKLLWTRVQGGVLRVLQRTTLAELVEFSQSHTPVAAA
jgi:Rrf2 family protein